MKLALVQATIRRDAFTTTTTTVPEHELKIVRAIFGKENVKVGSEVGEREFEPDSEYDRLCQKYGDEKTIAIYGEPENNKLADEMTPKKGTKPAATE